MGTVTLIPATTAGGTAILSTGNYPAVSIMATNLAGAEVCDVEPISPDGTAVTPLSWDGRSSALDSTNGAVTVSGGIDYLITLSTTATASMVSFTPITHPN